MLGGYVFFLWFQPINSLGVLIVSVQTQVLKNMERNVIMAIEGKHKEIKIDIMDGVEFGTISNNLIFADNYICMCIIHIHRCLL